MRETVTISGGLTTDWLNSSIKHFINENSYDPYLIMTPNTYSDMYDNNLIETEYVRDNKQEGHYNIDSTYKGYRIFLDPFMKDGKVELR